MTNHPGKGSNHQSTKAQNKALVLKIICTGTNVSRIELSRQTGLSKMSVTNIVNELMEEGYIRENALPMESSQASALGRKPISLEPSPDVYMSVGIYIARDFAAVTLANLKCEIVQEEKCSFTFDEAENTFLDKIIKLVASVLNSETAAGKKILGIGIASIGPLDIKKGIILDPPNFHKLRSIPIVEVLEKEFGYAVSMDNDMNASALAEKLYGSAKETKNLIYLGVTNGIGAGIIANNALFQGGMGFAGEIGHTTIHFEGPKCSCGNTGCLELYASIPEIVSQARNSVALGMPSSLKELPAIEWTDIIHHAAAGDYLSINLIDRLSLYISIGLVSLINIFDPEVIYLGHEIALAGDLVAKSLSNTVNERTISRTYKKVEVRISSFKDHAPVSGSNAIVFNRLFSI